MKRELAERPHVCSVSIKVDVHLNDSASCIVKPEEVLVRDGDHLHIYQPVAVLWERTGEQVVAIEREED